MRTRKHSQPKRGPAKTPLEYLMAVINDESVDCDRRDRLALALLPFTEAKVGVDSPRYEAKKTTRLKAAKEAASKYSVPAAPVLHNGAT